MCVNTNTRPKRKAQDKKFVQLIVASFLHERGRKLAADSQCILQCIVVLCKNSRRFTFARYMRAVWRPHTQPTAIVSFSSNLSSICFITQPKILGLMVAPNPISQIIAGFLAALMNRSLHITRCMVTKTGCTLLSLK